MTQSFPPVRPRLDVLPFPQLTWEQFEAAIRDLFRRLPGYRNVEGYGVRGDHQDGIDIRADDDAGHVGIQCKKVDVCRTGEARAAVRDATYAADRFVLALSRTANVSVRHVIDPLPNWELWDQQRLSDAVRSLPPHEAAEFVARHFDNAWVNAFLGYAAPATFIDRVRALAPLLDPARLINHAWTRVEDGGALDALQAFVGSYQQVALIDGPIGSGKSKLAFDLAEDLDYPVYFVVAGAPISIEGLREIRPGRALIIIDNADDAEGLALLLSHLLHHPEQKAILAASSGAVPRLDQELATADIEPAQIARISLGRLSRSSTVALARQVLGREDAEAEEALVQHAADTPLSTVLTARMIRDRTTTAQGLETEGEVRDIVRRRYREVATGAVSDEVPAADVRAVLQLLAALGPTCVDLDEFLNAAAAFLGWDVDRLLGVLGAIEDARILHRRGGTYSVAPEILRQSLMLEACVIRGRPTTYADRVLEAFPVQYGILQNLAIADLESRAGDGPDIFTGPWRQLTDRVRAATSLERAHFVGHLDSLGFFKPDEVFEIVADLVSHPATNDDEQEYAQYGYAVDHQSVIREVSRSLRYVIMASRERIRGSVALLWDIEKDTTWAHISESPIKTVARQAKYEIGVGTGRAAAILDAVTAMIASGELDTPAHSLLEMIEPILARDVHVSLLQGTQLTIRRVVVDVNAVRELRDRAIAVVAETALGADERRATKAIKILAALLREPEHFVGEPSGDARAAWDRERALALDAFDRIVENGMNPIRELVIADQIHYYALHSPSELARTRATTLLERIGTKNDRDQILISEFCQLVKFHRHDESSDFSAANRRLDEFEARAAAEWLAAFPDPEVLVSELRQRVTAIGATGLYGSPIRLLTWLVQMRPGFDERFVETILAANDPGVLPWVTPFLRAAFILDPAVAVALAERLFAREQPAGGIAVANAVVYESPRADGDRLVRRDLLRRLLSHGDIDVRCAAGHALFYFRRVSADDVPALAASAEIGTDAALADRVYMTLPDVLTGIDDSTVETLVEKLVPLTTLEPWPRMFLARLAPTRSARVLDVIARRLYRADNPEGYMALPFAAHEIAPLMEALAASPTFEDDAREMIRKWGGEDSTSLSRMPTFLAHVANVRPTFVKVMITDALASPSGELQRAALLWIRRLPHAVLEGDSAFVVAILERAHRIGPEMGQRAEASILAELITGAEAVAAYSGAPGDIRLQTVAAAGLACAELSVPVRRFFLGLSERGRRGETATIERAEESFGPQ